MAKTFALGIDLGTSNSAVAVAPLSDEGAQPSVILEVPQLTAANVVGSKATLPSAAYVVHGQEFGDGLPKLPWENEVPSQLLGSFAREHGAMVPDRLITSAKSWLSNAHVDPRSEVLPWGADLEEGEKTSALAASVAYLRHLKEAFQAVNPDWSLDEGEAVVTVPASFDEVARNLTSEAAEEAGLGEVVLLEEPQAAFYAWTAQAGSDWRRQVSAGDVILVCDVGGGTADFSLIAMTEEGGNLELERIAVGEHLLLGGDNMDLALGYTLKAKLEADGTTIDDWQLRSLIQSCRRAKEALFGDPEKDAEPISIPSRGSSLFTKTVSVTLDRATLEAVVLDGFLPMTSVTDLPAENAGTGLQEFGLPYASDPVVSKHLARFLTRSLANVKSSEALTALMGSRPEAMGDQHLKPSAVLFNGGVFKSDAVRNRVLDLLGSWDGGNAPSELQGFEPDLAVAQGATVYAGNRATGTGLRIKAGTARSYYVGLETSMPAIPGFKPPLKAVCVVPQGMEEGSEERLMNQEFGLVPGGEATFRFLSSEVRGGDEPGTIINDAEAELEETSRLTVTLDAVDGEAGQMVPVQLLATVTELGNLELYMQHTGNAEQRWKLDFKVRTE